MPDQPQRVTNRHLDYVAEHTSGDDEFIASLKRAALDAALPAIWAGVAQISLMQVVLRAAQAKTVVEIGTLAGSTAIALARALPQGGVVHTLEFSDRHADFAEAWVKKSDVAAKVRVIRGDARQTLKQFKDGTVDATFIDADKEGYQHYLEESHRILRTGGLVMVDNAFAFGQLFADVPEDSGVHYIRNFNKKMAADKRFHGVIVPLGDGCWVGVKVQA